MNFRFAKTFLISLAILVGLCGILFSVGPWFPFVPVSIRQDQDIANTKDLDTFIIELESKTPNIKLGLAKGIVWANPAARVPTDTAIIYLHGFSASRKELSPVIENVGSQINANVFFTRLKAHGLQTEDGTASEAFGNVMPQDWLDDAREAMTIGRRIGQRVIVVGMSTGALLALHLAFDSDSQMRPDALVLLSPNFHPKSKLASIISGPFGRFLAKNLIGRERGFEPSNEAHARFWTTRYRSEAIASLMDLVHSVGKLDLRQLQTPVLVVYTKKDKVVDVPLIERRFEEIGSINKALVELEAATRHELASEALSPQAIEPAVKVIKDFIVGLPK